MNTSTTSTKRGRVGSRQPNLTFAGLSERARLIIVAAAERLSKAADISSPSVLGEYLPIHNLLESILREDSRVVAELLKLYYAVADVRPLDPSDPQDVGNGTNLPQTVRGYELSGTSDIPQTREAGQRQPRVSVYISSYFENDIAIAQPDFGRTVILMIAPKGARQISEHPADRARLMFSRARHMAVEARQELSGGHELMHIEALILDLTLDGPSAEAGVIGLGDLDEYLCTGDSIGTQFIPHYRAELTALIDEHALWRTVNMIRRRLLAAEPDVSSKPKRTETPATADELSRMPAATVRLGEPPALASGQ